MSKGSKGSAVCLALALTAAPLSAQQSVKLPARDVALQGQPASLFNVGTVEGRDWEMFAQVRGIAFDAADNMYLLDGQNLRVIVFDRDGRYVRQFGRRGGGPGEFQAPLALDVTTDGNVVVSDLGNRAFIVFTPEGQHVRNVTFNEHLGFPMSFVADASGGVIARVMPRPGLGEAAAQSPSMSTIFRQTLDEDGSRSPHALYQVPVTPPRVIENSGSSGERRVASIRMDPIFSPRPTFGAVPGGLAVHHTNGYEIRVLDDNGRHLRTYTRDIQPRKVTKKEQDAWHERRREGERTGNTGTIVMSATTTPGGSSVSIGGGANPPRGAVAFNMDNVEFAEVMSVISSIRTDAAGRLWVQRRMDDGREAGPIDLIAADGRYIGTLPAQAMPRAVSATGRAAWVETDDLGVERVVVRQLPSAWR